MYCKTVDGGQVEHEIWQDSEVWYSVQYTIGSLVE